MLQALNFVLNLFLLLPWWGALGVLAALFVGFYAFWKYAFHRMEREIIESVASQGTALEDALVSVNSVERTAAPGGPSFDDDPEGEDFDPECDGNLTDDEADYYWVDATIAPADPQTVWEPSALSLVKFDFEPREKLEATDQLGVLHTLEILRGREFVPLGEGEVTGPQRLRLLFAVTKGLSEVKFAYHFTYFGRLSLHEAAPAHAHC